MLASKLTYHKSLSNVIIEAFSLDALTVGLAFVFAGRSKAVSVEDPLISTLSHEICSGTRQ